MLLFSKEDIRAIKKDQILNQSFYIGIFNNLEKIFNEIFVYNKRQYSLFEIFELDEFRIQQKIEYYADYFELKLPFKKISWVYGPTYSPKELMGFLKSIYIAFEKEYYTRFGTSYDLVKTRIQSIDNDVEKLNKEVVSLLQNIFHLKRY
jgi:hypothetical protein